MIFRQALAAKMMAGEKTVTRRLCSKNPRSPWWTERCRYRVGQRFAVQAGRGKNGKAIGYARVVSVHREPLGDTCKQRLEAEERSVDEQREAQSILRMVERLAHA